MIFHSPGRPSPATALRKPGGGSLSLAPLKSKYRSAAAPGPANKTKTTETMKRNIAPQRNKKEPGDKCLRPARQRRLLLLLVNHFCHRAARGNKRQDVFGVGCDDVEDIRFVRIEHPLQRGGQVLFEHDAFGRHIEAFGHGDEV